MLRADARFRCGRSAEAFSDLANVESLIQATDEETALDFVRGYLARVEGQRGLEDDCRRHAAAAIASATRLGLGTSALMATHGLAVLELGLGRHDLAIEHLDRIAADVHDWGIDEPGALWWQPDHVETLLVRRRTVEAVEITEALAARAATTPWRFTPAAAAWCRAMITPPEAGGRPGSGLGRRPRRDGRHRRRVRAGAHPPRPRARPAAPGRRGRPGAATWPRAEPSSAASGPGPGPTRPATPSATGPPRVA